MVTENILNVSYKSHRSTSYKVASPEVMKEVLLMQREGKLANVEKVEVGIRDEIFSTVIGYDDIKRFLKAKLEGQKRLHFLFEDSPSHNQKPLYALYTKNDSEVIL